MTRIGVVSDSHGSSYYLNEAAGLLKNCTVVYHLGDHSDDAEILLRNGINVISVPGNCDMVFSEPYERIDIRDGIRIFLTHGHRYSVKFSLLRLRLTAEQENCNIALFGHTHSPVCEYDGSVLLLNPGALKNGQYAIILIDETGIHPELKQIDKR